MTATITDLLIHCADCGEAFSLSTNEQRFYAERGLPNPVRCPDCRARRRSERNGDAMRAAESTPSSNGGEGFGNYGGATNGGRKSARGGMKMFSVVCTSCGRPTEVPFEPRGNRPVYCRDCFAARRGR